MTMFSSNPFPELPSSPDNLIFPPNILFHHENDSAFFNYHLNNRDPLISGDCLHDISLATPSPVIPTTSTIEEDFSWQQQQVFEDHDDLLDSVIASYKKTTAVSKKAGHSKIYTGRGLRDRRVRLSIDISRKFFCLQDLLGFDKASKTLDWLFGKCKTSIQELVKETNRCPSSTTTFQSKTSFLEAIMEGGDEGKSKKKSQLKYVDDKRKKVAENPTGGFQDNLAKDQSRAVARARARERAREKMRIRKLDDELKTLANDHDDFDFQNFKSSAAESDRMISAYPAAWVSSMINGLEDYHSTNNLIKILDDPNQEIQ
ncbi:hypothetical protein LXL04_006424 [Taraxacum kok-saghyz]